MKLAKLGGAPEIFYSIQGEGISMGKPAIFVRLSQCNLHCIWCDTDYTWNWVNTPFEHVNDSKKEYNKYDKSDWILELPSEEIFQLVKKYPCKRVILTGGEPLMQQKELEELSSYLKRKGYFIEIETNGTLLPSTKLDELIDQYNISPKLSNSNNELKLRIKNKTLAHFSSHAKAFFKFVVDTEEDCLEIQDLISQFNIDPQKVYLMPQGTDSDTIKKKQKWLVEMCKSSGYNFTDRMHIHLYGDKRGV